MIPLGAGLQIYDKCPSVWVYHTCTLAIPAASRKDHLICWLRPRQYHSSRRCVQNKRPEHSTLRRLCNWYFGSRYGHNTSVRCGHSFWLLRHRDIFQLGTVNVWRAIHHTVFSLARSKREISSSRCPCLLNHNELKLIDKSSIFHGFSLANIAPTM